MTNERSWQIIGGRSFCWMLSGIKIHNTRACNFNVVGGRWHASFEEVHNRISKRHASGSENAKAINQAGRKMKFSS